MEEFEKEKAKISELKLFFDLLDVRARARRDPSSKFQKKKISYRRHVVGRRVVEVGRHVGGEEPPVLDVEAHVAERKQLEKQQREEQ